MKLRGTAGLKPWKPVSEKFRLLVFQQSMSPKDLTAKLLDGAT